MFSNLFTSPTSLPQPQQTQPESLDMNIWLAFANIMHEFNNTKIPNNGDIDMKLHEKTDLNSSILINALAQINSQMNTSQHDGFLRPTRIINNSISSISEVLTNSSDYSSFESPYNFTQSNQSSLNNSSGFSIPNLITDEEKIKIEDSLDRITIPSSDSPHSLESPLELASIIRAQQGQRGRMSSTPNRKDSKKNSSPSDTSIIKKYTCHICSKEYHSMSALKMHIRTHTLPCRCEVCGKAFSRMWLLNGHIRTHTGEKPFSCSICNRAFADRSNLRAHMQTHSDVKRYRCNKCGKTFSRMGLLTKHKNTNCSPKSDLDQMPNINTSLTQLSPISSSPQIDFSIAFLTEDKSS